MRLTKNFRLEEFASRDGSKMTSEVLENIKILANQLQILRDYIEQPIHINSGYRSVTHNMSIGGSRNSYHVRGMAADISVKNLKPKKVRKAILELIKMGGMLEGGIGLYNGFVHYDFRGVKSRWNKSTFF